jgi:hypothetical protein
LNFDNYCEEKDAEEEERVRKKKESKGAIK